LQFVRIIYFTIELLQEMIMLTDSGTTQLHS